MLIYIEFCYVSQFLYRQIGQTFSTNQRDEVTSILTSLLFLFFLGGVCIFPVQTHFSSTVREYDIHTLRYLNEENTLLILYSPSG